jgi:phosphoribosylglycinamide formyltransferase 1
VTGPEPSPEAGTPIPVAVFASGSGTTLQALLDHEGPGVGWRVAVVVSDRENAGALERAASAGRSGVVIPVSGRSAGEVATDTLAVLEQGGVRLVLLAGYLRLLPAQVVAAFRRRILNVHPSLLPAFGGKGMYGIRVHEAVLDHGVRVTGATVHLADEEYDRGTILAQWPVPVLPGDRADDLAARVQEVERALYPLVVDHAAREVAEGRDPLPPPPAGPHYILPPGGAGSALPAEVRRGFGGS